MESKLRSDLLTITTLKGLIELWNNILLNKYELSYQYYILLAESSISYKYYLITTESLKYYYNLNPPKDQYYIRSLLCKSIIENNVYNLKGEQLILQINKSISYILAALNICDTSTNIIKYNFLIYNASILYWNTIRPLMRDSYRKEIIESLTKVVTILEKIITSNDNTDIDWLAEYYCLLSICLDDAGQLDNAINAITKAIKLAPQLSVDLKEKILRYQIHLNRSNKKQYELSTSEQEKSEWFAGAKFLVILQSIRSGLLTVNDGLTTCSNLITKQYPNKTNISLELSDTFGELALLAYQKNNFNLSKDIANKIIDTRSTGLRKGWILAEAALISCEMIEKDHIDLSTSDKTIVARRVQELKRLEENLDAASRLNDPFVIEEICIVYWNMLLPCMKPKFRSYFRNFFSKCVNALEQIESTLNLLQVQYHNEITLCEIDADFVEKASFHIDKALELDYTIPVKNLPQELQQVSDVSFFQRPLDTFLIPIREKLTLKSNLYKDPDSPEEEAMIVVEQAKETKDLNLKHTLINRAIGILNNSKNEPIILKRATLWFDISSLCWELKLIDSTKHAIEKLLSYSWDATRHKQFLIQQLKAHFILAELSATLIHDAGFNSGESTDSAKKALLDSGEDIEIELKLLDQVNFNQIQLIDSLLAVLNIGSLLKEEFLISQAAVYLWNYHLILFQSNSYDAMLSELGSAIDKVINVLITLTTKNIPLICGFAEALSKYYETNLKHDKAIEICKKIIPLSNSYQKREILRCLARCNKNLAKSDAPNDDRESQAIYLLEQILISNEDSKLNQLIELLKSPNSKSSSDNENKALNDCRADWALKLLDIDVQIECEVWVLLAEVLLKKNKAMQALDCCKKVLISLHGTYIFQYLFDVESSKLSISSNDRIVLNNGPSQRLWRWYSVASRLAGDAYIALIDPELQDKPSQDLMRADAIEFYKNSGIYGRLASDIKLILYSAQQLWNSSIPFMKNKMSRKTLRDPLAVFFHQLGITLQFEYALNNRNKDCANAEFRCNLYCLYFEVLTDFGDWNLGITDSDIALENLPSHLHKNIWQFRIIFMSKLGMSVDAGVSKAKGKEDSSQSKLWNSLAKASSSQFGQFTAFQKSVDSMKVPIDKVEPLIEFGQWLLVQNLHEEAKDSFLSAAEILLDLERHDDDEEKEGEDNTRSIASKSSSRSKRSANSQRSKHMSINSSSKSKKRPDSNKSNAKTISLSHLSRVKSNRSEASNVHETLEDETLFSTLNVKRLVSLAQIYSILAQCSTSIQDKENNALLAYHFVCRVWKTSIETSNEILEEDAKLNAKIKDVKLFNCPNSFQEWVDFSVSPELNNLFKRGKQCMTISEESLVSPLSLISNLEKLHNTFIELGFHLHVLPVINLIEYAANEILHYRALFTLNSLRHAILLDQLQCDNDILSKLEPILPTDEEAKLYREEIEQQEQFQLKSNSNSIKIDSSNSGEISIRKIWCETSQILISIGKLTHAKSLLKEAQRHCEGYDDYETLSFCLRLRSKICMIEGDFPLSLKLCYESQKVFKGDSKWWYSSICFLVEILFSTVQNDDAINILKHSIKNFKQIGNHEAKRCQYLLEYLLGQKLTCTEIILDFDQYSEGLNSFKSAIAGLETIGDFNFHVKAILAYSKVILDDTFSQNSFDIKTNLALSLLQGAELTLQSRIGLALGGSLVSACLPVARDLANIKFQISAVLLLQFQYEQFNTSKTVVNNDIEFVKVEGADHRIIASYLTDISNQINQSEDRTLPPLKLDVSLAYSVAANNLDPTNEIYLSHLSSVTFYNQLYQVTSYLQVNFTPWKNGTSSLMSSFFSHTEEKIEDKSKKEKDDKKTATKSKDSKEKENFSISESLAELPSSLAIFSCLPLSFANSLSNTAHQIQLNIDKALLNTSSLSQCCVALAEFYGKLNPIETSRAIFLAQMADVQTLGIDFFVKTSSFDNSERLLYLLKSNIQNNLLNPKCVKDYELLDKYLSEKSLVFKFLKLDNFVSSSALPGKAWNSFVPIEEAFNEASPSISLPKETTVISIYFNKQFTNSIFISVVSNGQTINSFVNRLIVTDEIEAEMKEISIELHEFEEKLTKKFISDNIGSVESEACNQMFEALISDLNGLFAPLFIDLPSNLIDNRNVIILIDNPLLATFPFEAFSIFSQAKVVSRDFSFGFLLKRVQSQKQKSLRKKEINYICDPNLDDSGDRKAGFHDTLLSIKSKISEEWKGVSGSDHSPNISEYQRLITSCSGFLFYGFGSLFVDFDLTSFNSLPCSGVTFFHLADRSVNISSHRRQTKVLNSQSIIAKKFNSTFFNALAITLRGVESVLLNVFPISPSLNTFRVNNFWLSLSTGISIGAAFKGLQTISEPGKEKNYMYEKYNGLLYGLGNTIMDK